MATYSISYDLVSPGKNYDELIQAIKAYGTWCHALKSTWFVVSNNSAAEIRDNLVKHIDSNDKLIVNRVRREAAWQGLSKEISDWLQKNLQD